MESLCFLDWEGLVSFLYCVYVEDASLNSFLQWTKHQSQVTHKVYFCYGFHIFKKPVLKIYLGKKKKFETIYSEKGIKMYVYIKYANIYYICIFYICKTVKLTSGIEQDERIATVQIYLFRH